jgi:hypothetical protein
MVRDLSEVLPERRATIRYATALRVELWPESESRPVALSFYTTRDVSTAGFHFFSRHSFNTGARLCFRIVFPAELSGRMTELMGGVAECVRVEEVRGADIDQFGVGAHIQKTTHLVGDF